MKLEEKDRVRIDTRAPSAWRQQDGRATCPLFSNDNEQVCLQRLAPGEPLFSSHRTSAELLVLHGQLNVADQPYEQGSWMRQPEGDALEILAGAQGAMIYLKTGHLLDICPSPARPIHELPAH
ncbi:cupin domain-containing protein [Pseudomonas citri]|uniref:cupin domain-containing protein n=1 Tax=Pseudomonas citri TaxID=2978349 RepID=UPI0021B5E6DB|nr:cupin domain-containing protein [Pseudomonas citri]